MKVYVSTGNSRMEKRWNGGEMELEDFVRRISRTIRTAETVEQYRKLSLENIVQRIPVVSWMFSPGFLCWVFVFAGLYWVSCRAWAQLSAFLPVFLNWLTVLLGPTYLVRYVLIFWFALPLLLIVINIQMCYTAMDSEP